jgi:hypothetical protein
MTILEYRWKLLRGTAAALLVFAGGAPTQLDADASRLHVTRASVQEWSGGPAGLAGTKYTITLVSGYAPATVAIAGTWIEDRYVAFPPDDTRPHGLPANVLFVENGDEVEYRIDVRVDRDLGFPPPKESGGGPGAAKPRPAVQGKALLDVQVDGKARPVPIIEFQRLPAANYP